MKQKIIFFILAYFRFFAKLQLTKNSPLIIGVTGSAGKTTAQNAIAALLKGKRKIKVGYKANSETGIPLNILGLSPTDFSMKDWLRLMLLCPIKLLTNWEKYDTYIVEMGIDSPLPPKNMEYLLTIIKPDIGVILNASPMHSEPFDHLIKDNDQKTRSKRLVELIANEKGKIVTQLENQKTAIINTDQKEILNLKNDIKAKLITFGENKDSTVKFYDYKVDLTGTRFKFRYNLSSSKNQESQINIKNQLLPKHFGMTFAASICVGISLGISLEESSELIEKNFKLPAGRASLIEGLNDSLIIDSSYNSSAKPTIDMLDMMSLLNATRKISVLGDIRELGQVSQLEHEKVAKKAIKVCSNILLIGPLMKKFALPLIKKSSVKVDWFENAYQASDFLRKDLKKDDLILVKGSQNTLLLEILVEELMKNSGDADRLLARRGEFWDNRRINLK